LENDEIFMQEAYNEALKAFKNDEVPIGAIVVKNGEIIGRGFNEIEIRQDPTAHAEIIAIRQAAQNLETWILDECDLYITLEPCVMCLGAIFQSRIKRVIYSGGNSRYGAVTKINYIDFMRTAYNREPEIVGGIYEEKCTDLLLNFFKKIRLENKDRE
jgi:tRNA(adenine34) deaminase